MLRIVLIHPGATDLDEQNRIKGSLDVPLNESGVSQVAATTRELADFEIEAIYTSPCESSTQTAHAINEELNVKLKTIDRLKNLNHGLWHGKLISEVKTNQPKLYRLWQESPETMSPPEGESFADAKQRVETAVAKILKKHKRGTVALVVPEPLSSIAKTFLTRGELGNLWKCSCDAGQWEIIEIEPAAVPV